MTDLFHEYLKYNHETGLFSWIKKSSNRTNVGDAAGSFTSIEAASAAYLFNKPKYHPLNPMVRI